MKGFSVDSQSKKSQKVESKEPPAFVKLDCDKPAFRHLKQAGRSFVSLVSKVDPQYQKHFK